MSDLIKLEFANYVTGSALTWEDWSKYLVDPPVISKKVESENEGEAGVIAFDNTSISLRYKSGNPVHNKFSEDLTSVERYVFKISTRTKNGSFVPLFQGLVDFTTIEWDTYEYVISVNLVDNLSALGILPADALRSIEGTVYSRLGFTTSETLDIFADVANPGYYFIRASMGGGADDMPVSAFTKGEVLSYTDVNGDTQHILIKDYTRQLKTDGYGTNYYVGYISALVTGTISSDPSNCYFQNADNVYSLEVYGADPYIYSGGNITAFDALKIIQVLYEQVWGSATVVNKTGAGTYPITLGYFPRLIGENPLGSDPLAALKTLADTMRCYIYVDKSSQLVIQSKNYLTTNGTTRTLGTTKVVKKPRKYFWDKLADGVTVNLKSWITDVNGNYIEGTATVTKQIPGTTTFIKPKNSLNKDLLTDDPADNTQNLLNTKAATLASQTLSFYGVRRSEIDYTLALDDNTINWELIDNITINSVAYFFPGIKFDLGARTVEIPFVECNGHDFDIRQVVIGLSESNSVGLSSSSSYSGGSGSGISYVFDYPFTLTGNLVQLGITDNLQLTGNQLDTIQPIKTTSEVQFVKIGIGTAPDPSYSIKATGDISANAYYGDGSHLTGVGGTYTAAVPLVLTASQFSLDYNTTNLKLTTNQLNTIQNIAAASSPTFAGLTLTSFSGVIKASTGVLAGGATTTDLPEGTNLYYTDARARAAISETVTGLDYNNSTGVISLTTGYVIPTTTEESNWNDAYSKRVDTWNYPLSFSSNVVSFGYNSTNLKLTTNLLNTIQDIAITSNVQFGAITGTGRLTVPSGFPFEGIRFSYSTSDYHYITTHIDGGVATSNSIQFFVQSATGVQAEVMRLRGDKAALFSGDIIQSGNKSIYNNFTSGWAGSGFRLDYGVTTASRSNLEIDNLTVRKTMSIYELLIRQINAVNGNLFVSSNAKCVSANSTTITFEDPTGHNVLPFAAGDMLIAQRLKSNGDLGAKLLYVEFSVTSVTSMTVTGTWNTAPASYSDVTGVPFVRNGNTSDSSRRGSIYLAADDTNSPFIDVIDGVDSWTAWGNSSKTKARLGKQDGLTDPILGALSGYGLYTQQLNLSSGGQQTNAITMVANSSSARLRMYQSSNCIFDFDTASSTAKIAGWNFTDTYLRNGSSSNGTTNTFKLAIQTEQGYGSGSFITSDYVNPAGYNVIWYKDGIGYGRLTMGHLYDHVESPGGYDSGKYGLEMFSNINLTTPIFRLSQKLSDGVLDCQIASWKFDNQYLWKLGSGTPASSPAQGIVLNSTGKSIGVYGSSWQRSVYMFYTDDSNYGIKGYSSDGALNTVFQLGSTNKIGKVSFDYEKLYVTKNISGLGDQNIIKIGDYTYSTPSNILYSTTTLLDNSNFTSSVSASDNTTNWKYTVAGLGNDPTFTVPSNVLTISTYTTDWQSIGGNYQTTNGDVWLEQYVNTPSNIADSNVEFTFTYKMGNDGTNSNYTKQLLIDVTFNTGTSLTGYYIGRSTGYTTVTILIKVPAGTTSMLIKFKWNGQVTESTNSARTWESCYLKTIALNYYKGTFTSLNGDGLRIYRSPYEKVEFIETGLLDIVTSKFTVGRWELSERYDGSLIATSKNTGRVTVLSTNN